MKKAAAMAAMIALVLSLAAGAHAQTQKGARQTQQRRDAELRGLRDEIEALREEQKMMREELQEVKALLQVIVDSIASARQRTVSIDDDPVIGESTSKVVLIDFSDYQ